MSTPEHAEPATEPSADFPPTTVMEAVEPPVSAEPEPAAAEHGATIDAPEPSGIVEALGRIEDRLAESQRLIDRQAEIAAKLHAENQVLRGGELRKAQGALVLSVLRVFDDVSRMAATTQDPAGRNDLAIVADALADALARNGVDALAVDVGEPYEPRKHKIAAIEPTLDAAADRTVASVVRTGFAWSDGEPLRVTDVAVFKYMAPPEAQTEAEAEPAAEAEPPAAQ
jgi:molecular chaperone GrpE (heat shock protein)